MHLVIRHILNIRILLIFTKYARQNHILLVIYCPLVSNKPLRFRNTIDHRIRQEKMQYYINREVAKISAFSSEEIDKYEYPIGEYLTF